jgi:glutaredoxin 2
MTPLYKKLKENGTSFYAFPGAAEDISVSYQNVNHKMYFSKYVLLNLPKQNTSSTPKYFDFANFKKSSNAQSSSTFSEQIIESLRNYIANHEMVIRESKLNSTKYYYNVNSLETTTEKIFWKWCKKLNLIDFDPAVPDDEYVSNLTTFDRRNLNDDEYLPEYLWKEREVIEWSVNSTNNKPVLVNGTTYTITFNGKTNFKTGDFIFIKGLNGTTELTTNFQISILTETNGNHVITISTSLVNFTQYTLSGAYLIYNRLVQYIGEVTGVSNVQEANRSYTEVHAHIPDHTGMTPDILFRTTYDSNYKPSMTFPIIPSQYQPEILGAENFQSPIVNSPLNYPGSYFGQFDTVDFTYTTSPGDIIRRVGNYFGVSGDINNLKVDSSGLDGLGITFNTSHYSKMNGFKKISNFDQFNALDISNLPPSDFEFNAILWYYTVEDNNGNSATNLYGISFLDNPNNSVTDKSFKFPTYKKLVSTNTQDGTSYAFNLNLNYNIANDNVQDTYNPEAINSMFSMSLFNQAMSKLASTNDSFLNIISENIEIKSEINNLKGLLYTQNNINTINDKIKSLENLLKLYSTNQIVSSETIRVFPNTNQLSLENVDPSYRKIDFIYTTAMYNQQGIIPINIAVPINKSWLINIVNNDEVPLKLSNNDKLSIVLSRDLDFRQSCEIYISPSDLSTENKKLNIYIDSNIATNNGLTNQVLLVGDIDLPINYNEDLNRYNISKNWKEFSFNIDFNKQIDIDKGPVLNINLSENENIIKNSLNKGDVLVLNNFFVGTQSISDFSGQYKIKSVEGQKLTLDVSNSVGLVNYSLPETQLPIILHDVQSSIYNLANKPYFSLNKGKKIIITKVSNETNLSERYRVEVIDL